MQQKLHETHEAKQQDTMEWHAARMEFLRQEQAVKRKHWQLATQEQELRVELIMRELQCRELHSTESGKCLTTLRHIKMYKVSTPQYGTKISSILLSIKIVPIFNNVLTTIIFLVFFLFLYIFRKESVTLSL